MKRDMNLIRAILVDLQENCNGRQTHTPTPEKIKYQYSGTDLEFREHCRLIVERGLADVIPGRNDYSFTRLTWAGHDFLDNSKDSSVWQAAMKAAGHLSFDIFSKVLVEAATRLAMSQLQL